MSLVSIIRIAAVGLVLSCCASATLISDGLNQTVGVMLNGTVKQVNISWPAFQSADGHAVSASSTIINPPQTGPSFGHFSYALAPNSAGSFYTFTFYILNNSTGSESSFSAQVVVPQSIATLSLSGCQVTAPWWIQDIAVSGSAGVPTVSSNAISLMGIALSTTPADGQAYVYSATSNTLTPVPVPYWRKISVSYAQISSVSANTTTVNLVSRVNRQKVCGVATYITSGFSGAGITGMSVTVGDSNGTPNLYTPSNIDLRDNGAQDFNVMGSAVGAGNIQASFVSTGANLSALSSGTVDVDICLVNTP